MRRINLKKASVARSDTIRNINRQIVLNYVRERAPISRAEISHETELQRSTVSLIVEELKEQGLIDEIEGESTGGRPPLLLQLRAAGPIAIGVDLATEQTVIATSDLAGRVLTQKSFATDLPVKVDNDANAAALAELWFGRPEVREVRNFVMILVEEGLGTGIVFDGQIYHGEDGAAGEFGHMTIGSNAPAACAAGSHECWEAFASERAALARYAKLSSRDGGAP